MSESSKLWVIDIGEEFTAQEPKQESGEIIRSAPRVGLPIKQVAPTASAKAPTRPSRRLHFATAVVLTYLLGPFALLLWPKGRKSPGWAAVSLLSGLGLIAVAWQWRAILTLGNGASLLLPVLTAAAIVSLLGFTCWAMALNQAIQSRTRSHTAFPIWMRSGWAVIGLGLVAPGLGLFLTGSRRRAVAALWALWPVFPAAVILAHSGWTWRWLHATLHNQRTELIFENLMMAVAAVLVVGVTGWLVQALVGLHYRSQQLGRNTSAHGDRYAAALLVAVVALAVLAQPADLASLISETGDRLHEQGFQAIPLRLAQSAQKLDPGVAVYALQVAALHQERGEYEEATKVQREVDQDLQVYYGMLARQAPKVEIQESAPTESEPDSELKPFALAGPFNLPGQLAPEKTEGEPGPL